MLETYQRAINAAKKNIRTSISPYENTGMNLNFLFFFAARSRCVSRAYINLCELCRRLCRRLNMLYILVRTRIQVGRNVYINWFDKPAVFDVKRKMRLADNINLSLKYFCTKIPYSNTIAPR